eukprot:71485_1
MGNVLSKQWISGLSSYGLGLCVYSAVYAISFLRRMKMHGNTRKDSMEFASSVISIINALFVTITAAFFMLYHKYWDTPVRCQPGLYFEACLFSNSYFTVDGLADILIWTINKNTKHKFKLRIDVVLHHIFAHLFIPLLEIPNPVYFWFLLSMASFIEISTIFLNIQFFAKFLNLSKKFKAISKFGFVLSWFMCRLPASIAMIWWLVHYFTNIKSLPLIKSVSVSILVILNGIVQGLWSIQIIKKIIQYLMHTETGEVIHGDMIQLG